MYESPLKMEQSWLRNLDIYLVLLLMEFAIKNRRNHFPFPNLCQAAVFYLL